MPLFLNWIILVSSLLICGTVWGMLSFYAQRSELKKLEQRRFMIISAVILFGWWTTAYVLAGNGIFIASSFSVIPAIAISGGILFPILIGTFLLQRSRPLKLVINAIPLHSLVGLQFYRAIGAIFIVLYGLDRLPGVFARPAGWGDVAVGITAPIVGYVFYKNYQWSKNAVIVWNIFGILDLIVAVTTGFLSSPSRFQMVALDNPNRLISAFPLVLVPVFAVPLSIVLHIAVVKRLNFWRNITQHPGQ